jgi:hypothetical protein
MSILLRVVVALPLSLRALAAALLALIVLLPLERKRAISRRKLERIGGNHRATPHLAVQRTRQ